MFMVPFLIIQEDFVNVASDIGRAIWKDLEKDKGRENDAIIS